MHTPSPIPNPTITRKAEVGPYLTASLPSNARNDPWYHPMVGNVFVYGYFMIQRLDFDLNVIQQSKTFLNTAILIPSINASSLFHFLSTPLESFPHLVLIIASKFFLLLSKFYNFEACFEDADLLQINLNYYLRYVSKLILL